MWTSLYMSKDVMENHSFPLNVTHKNLSIHIFFHQIKSSWTIKHLFTGKLWNGTESTSNDSFIEKAVSLFTSLYPWKGTDFPRTVVDFVVSGSEIVKCVGWISAFDAYHWFLLCISFLGNFRCPVIILHSTDCTAFSWNLCFFICALVMAMQRWHWRYQNEWQLQNLLNAGAF